MRDLQRWIVGEKAPISFFAALIVFIGQLVSGVMHRPALIALAAAMACWLVVLVAFAVRERFRDGGRTAHVSLDGLAEFSAAQLAFASRIVAPGDALIPFGVTRSFTYWNGAEDKINVFPSETSETSEAIARDWFAAEHERSTYVAEVVDVFLRPGPGDAQKTDAIRVLARTCDNSMGLLLYLPYHPATEGAPLRFGDLVIDFPEPFAALAAESQRVRARAARVMRRMAPDGAGVS